MTAAYRIDRRDFFGLVGGGIVVLFGLDPSAPAAAAERPGYPDDFHAYLAIGANGRVTVFSGKIEMGQGVMTSLAQMAAEELGVDLASIDMVMGDTDKCPWDMRDFRFAVDADVRAGVARGGGKGAHGSGNTRRQKTGRCGRPADDRERRGIGRRRTRTAA